MKMVIGVLNERFHGRGCCNRPMRLYSKDSTNLNDAELESAVEIILANGINL